MTYMCHTKTLNLLESIHLVDTWTIGSKSTTRRVKIIELRDLAD